MSAAGDAPAPRERELRRLGPRRVLLVGGALVAALLALALLLRFGVLAPQAQLVIEAQADGLELGRFGTLETEGLSGDVWRDFRIARLTLSDEKGVWLEARDITVQWNYLQLLRRRLDAEQVRAEHVTVFRRPVLSPKRESRGLPISVEIDRLAARVETRPAFSSEPGLFDLTGRLEVGRRNAGQSGELHAVSRLRAGDALHIGFSFGTRRPLRVDVTGREARGGALAGALGLPADLPFAVEAEARGAEGRGRLQAWARSGETRPLSASGVWTPAGAKFSARVDLTASELTRPVARAVGPEAELQFTLGPLREGARPLLAQLSAANLTVQAQGPVRPGARRIADPGLRMVAATPDAGRILPGPELGAARFAGVLEGGADQLDLHGVLVLQEVSFGGYRLARLTSDVAADWRNGRLTVETQIAGAGGTGAGALGALLGARPTASLAIRRTADGEIRLERLELDAAGLEASARGRRGVLGGFTVRGEAEVTNLGALRPGAAGSLRVGWEARQAKTGAPWSISVDGTGRRLATGFNALDRLLGPRPRLTADARLAGGEVAVRNATLRGARLRAEAAGLLDGPKGVRLKLDWRAEGPIGVGPIEIAGAARGEGALTGPLSAARLDLTANFARVDIPRVPLRDVRLVLSLRPGEDGSTGVAALTATSPYGPARARTEFGLPPGALRLRDLSVDAGGVAARGDVTLRRGRPSAADLRIAVGPGAMLARGSVTGALRITGRPGDLRADLDLSARGAQPRGAGIAVRSARLTAAGPLTRLPFRVQADGRRARTDWRIQGGGVVADTTRGLSASFAGEGRVGDETLRTLRPALLRLTDRERVAEVSLVTGRGGRVTGQARLTESSATLEAQARDVRLALLNEDLLGRISADVRLAGRGPRLQGSVTARLTGARARGAEARLGLDAEVVARLRDERLTVDARGSNAAGLRARAHLTLPAEASAAPLRLAVHRRRPMSGDISAQGEIAPLWDLLVGGERTLAGAAAVSARIAGSLADPHVFGRASLIGGRFVDGATGLTLRDATLRATFSDEAVQVTEAQARDGQGGRLTGAGRISLLRNGASSLRLTLERFQVIDTDIATAAASGRVTAERSADGKIRLAGTLVVDEAEVSPSGLPPPGVITLDVIEVNRPPELAPPPEPRTGGPSIALDVNLQSSGRVFVRGRGLDVELALDAHVGGTTADPQLSGVARVVRGDYSFAGKRFVFDRESRIRLSTEAEEIRLDLTARRTDPTLSALIRIGGTAARPEITLSSSPALPQDEILAQVLFGRSAAQLSTLEAARLAAALSSLRGGAGGFDVLANLRELTGLDRLALVGGEASGLAVAGGRYLSDDVYLEIIGGGREGPSVVVEWRVTPSLSVVSGLAGDRGADIAVRWRRDY